MTNYCLPIIASTKEAVFKQIEANRHMYEYFEIWLDYIPDVDAQFVETVVSMLGEKLLLLFRRQRLETPHMPEGKRRVLMRLLDGKDAYLDLDIATQEKDVKFIHAEHLTIKCILSYHNYTQTPTDRQLQKIETTMEKYAPAIYKFATYCNTESDAVRLLQLLIKMKDQGKQYIVLGMGEHGVITRIFGTRWGNAMIFAPKNNETQSAPGQLTREQLEKIFAIIQ